MAAGISYREYPGGRHGEGRPPLFLIHGAGGSGLHWPPHIRRLPGERVLCPDLPGHGASKGEGEQTIGGYAARLMEWMEELGMDRAVWVGHSMGGAVALRMALDAPLRVAGLVLVASGARLRVNEVVLQMSASDETFERALDLMGSWAFGPQATPALVETARKRMVQTRRSVFHKDFLACNGFDVMGQLKEIVAPTLVLCGKEDIMTPEKYSRHLADSIPGASLQVLPGAGHMLMLEQPQAVAGAISGFMIAQFGRGESQAM